MDFLAGHHVRDTAAVGPFHDAITIRVGLCLSAIDINLTEGQGCSGDTLSKLGGYEKCTRGGL